MTGMICQNGKLGTDDKKRWILMDVSSKLPKNAFFLNVLISLVFFQIVLEGIQNKGFGIWMDFWKMEKKKKS